MINLRDPNEDLFSDSRMSFGQHLDELRKVLIRAIVCVAIGCGFGFYFANNIVEILQVPLTKAVVKFKKSMAQDDLEQELGYVPPAYVPLLREGWVPEKVNVDPGQLINVLRTAIPDFAEKVDLSPYSFNASHFKADELPSLCQRLANQSGISENENARLAAVWALMPESDQVTVGRVAGQGRASKKDMGELIAALNRVAKSEKLAEGEAFANEFAEPQWTLWSMLEKPEPKPLVSLKATIDDPDTLPNEADNLRRRLNRSLLTTLFAEQMQPLRLDTMELQIWKQTNYKPQSLGVTEPFFVWLKAGLLGGLTIAAPLVFWQIWSFVAAGLYPNEKKYVHLFLPVSLMLFAAGVALAFFFVFSPVLEFLFTFNKSLNISPEIRIGEWLSFAMFLPLGFGVAFQLPLVMLFVNRIGLITVEAYIDKWRIAILVIFVLSMFLTPADPISMLLLAVPLTGLYFMGILMCQFMPATQNPFGADAAAKP